MHMYMLPFQVEVWKREPKQFSSLHLLFAHRANGSLSLVNCWRRNKRKLFVCKQMDSDLPIYENNMGCTAWYLNIFIRTKLSRQKRLEWIHWYNFLKLIICCFRFKKSMLLEFNILVFCSVNIFISSLYWSFEK
jgi:hypothetical protein